jgi:hypothetical protein
MATENIGEALLGTTGVSRRLTGEGRQSMNEWIDRVRDAHDWSPERRGQLVQSIFEVRRDAAEQRLSTELNRLGLLSPAERERLRFRLSEDSAYMRKMRRDAERQADRIIATDRAYREKWAEQRKAEPYPIRNRYQLNAELEQNLAERAEWKTRDIVQTESSIASNDAAQQMYAESGVADPAADPWWHYVGPSDSRTCDRCDLLIADTSDGVTRDDLDEMLAAVNAMAPPIMHVHCRHDADFKPPRGYVRRKENREKARGWAVMNGHFEDRQTGNMLLIPPPAQPPQSVRTKFPEFVNEATARRICGMPVGKAMSTLRCGCRLLKWAMAAQIEDRIEMPCDAMSEQLLGDAGEDVVRQAFKMRSTGKTDPLAGIGDDIAAEIKVLRPDANGGNPRIYSDTQMRETREAYARKEGVRPVSIINVVDDEAGEMRLYARDGIGGWSISTMEHVATVESSSGRLLWHVDELPWGGTVVREAVEEAAEEATEATAAAAIDWNVKPNSTGWTIDDYLQQRLEFYNEAPAEAAATLNRIPGVKEAAGREFTAEIVEARAEQLSAGVVNEAAEEATEEVVETAAVGTAQSAAPEAIEQAAAARSVKLPMGADPDTAAHMKRLWAIDESDIADGRVRRKLERQLRGLTAQYPDVANALNPLEMRRLERGTMASMEFRPGGISSGRRATIRLSSTEWKRATVQKLEEEIEEGAAAGWWVRPASPDPEMHLTHEFGHAVEQRYTAFGDVDVKEWTKRWWPDAAEQAPSLYAREDRGEFFAECFTAIYHQPQDEWTDAVADLATRLGVQ